MSSHHCRQVAIVHAGDLDVLKDIALHDGAKTSDLPLSRKVEVVVRSRRSKLWHYLSMALANAEKLPSLDLTTVNACSLRIGSTAAST